jgi:hypothetical protein
MKWNVYKILAMAIFNKEILTFNTQYKNMAYSPAFVHGYWIRYYVLV